jgi:hypothetical protein
MRSPPNDRPATLNNRAIRSRIGHALRILFAPTEPPPKRFVDLLGALGQPKGRGTGETKVMLDEKLSQQQRAAGVVGRVSGQTRGSKGVRRVDGLPTHSQLGIGGGRGSRAKYRGDEEKRVEKVPGGYVVRDTKGQAQVYIYCRGDQPEASQARGFTEEEARWIAVNVAKLRRGD